MAKIATALGASGVLAAGALAFVVGLNRPGPEARDETAALARLSQRVEELALRVEEEAERREVLEETLAGMAFEMASARDAGLPAQAGVAGLDAPSEAPGHPSRPEPPGSGLDADTVVEAGFSRRDVEAYAEILDDVALRRLALRDRAAREGWLRTPRYAEESGALTAELEATRERFGDDFYDWAQYASGQPNRLRVGEVLAGSAAAEAGLEPGDIVQRYAEARVLSIGELRDLTTAGASGASTAVEVRRGSEVLRLYVPRGPLGVRLEPIRERPPPLR